MVCIRLYCYGVYSGLRGIFRKKRKDKGTEKEVGANELTNEENISHGWGFPSEIPLCETKKGEEEMKVNWNAMFVSACITTVIFLLYDVLYTVNGTGKWYFGLVTWLPALIIAGYSALKEDKVKKS